MRSCASPSRPCSRAWPPPRRHAPATRSCRSARSHKGMRCTAYSVVQGTDDRAVRRRGRRRRRRRPGRRRAAHPRALQRPERSSAPASGRASRARRSTATAASIGAISEAIGEYGGRWRSPRRSRRSLGQPGRARPSAPRRPRRPHSARSLAAPAELGGLSPRVARSSRARPPQAAHGLRDAPAGHAGRRSRSRAAPGRVDGDRPGQRRHHRGLGRHRHLRRRRPRLGASATRSTAPAGARCSSRTPTSSRSSTTRSASRTRAPTSSPRPATTSGSSAATAQSSVAGRLGKLPAALPMKVIARDQDTGRQRVGRVQIADETAVHLPTGDVAAGARRLGRRSRRRRATILGASPARQTGEMCAADHRPRAQGPAALLQPLRDPRGRRGPAGEDGLGAGARWSATSPRPSLAVDEFNFATLHVTASR